YYQVWVLVLWEDSPSVKFGSFERNDQWGWHFYGGVGPCCCWWWGSWNRERRRSIEEWKGESNWRASEER
ncbi:hypothetical protein HN51_016971, partial [Arachis hypogaea]